MSIPETTSAEAFERYVGGKCLAAGHGEKWRDVKAWVVALPPVVEAFLLPAVSEPFLVWIMSGEVDFQEREGDEPWITHRIKKGSFFLTSGGAPYECRWRAVTPESFQSMAVFIELPLLQRALEESFGPGADNARLQDLSAFTDDILDSLMERLRDELMRPQASNLLVQGLAQQIAVHLARDYGVTEEESRGAGPSLPGHKLRQITDWIVEHVAEDFDLAHLAAQAGLSKFHFQRLFKAAVGVSPSRYQINLRMSEARRLLRETKMSVVDVVGGNEVTNPFVVTEVYVRQGGAWKSGSLSFTRRSARSVTINGSKQIVDGRSERLFIPRVFTESSNQRSIAFGMSQGGREVGLLQFPLHPFSIFRRCACKCCED